MDDYLQQLGYTTSGGQIAQSLIVKTNTIKVKVSMLWTTGHFKFQQIEDDPYDYLALFGIEPNDGWLWLITKAAALANATQQHKRESLWIEFMLRTVPLWLTGHGGPIASGRQTVVGALGPP